MTPSQMRRAVAEVLAEQMPAMMDALAERILHKLQPPLPAPAAAVLLPTKEPVTALREQVEGVTAEKAPASAAEEQPLTIGKGAGRRLTDAGRARLKELAAKGLLPGAIARELGVSRGSVVLRLGDEPRPEQPGPSQPERDLARAEKMRAYQRERVRQARAAKKQAPAEAAPAATTVVVVPAAVVPAPPQPMLPSGVGFVSRSMSPVVARILERRNRTAPTPAAPMDPAQLEPVPASHEDALDWLFAHLVREGMNTAEVETRLAQLSTKQLLATCNAQRIKAGLSPYVLSERAA